MSWAWLKEIFAPEPEVDEWFMTGVGFDAEATGGGLNTRPAPKPRLAAVNRAPSRESFASWRDNPTTLFVFAALRNAAAEQKTAWDEYAWAGGNADQALLGELRTRADAYNALEGADYEAFCEWAGVDPQPTEDGNDAA